MLKHVYYLDDQFQKGYKTKENNSIILPNGQVYLELWENEFVQIFHHIELEGIVLIKVPYLSKKITSQNKLEIDDIHWGRSFNTEIRHLKTTKQTLLKEKKEVNIIKSIEIGFVNGERIYIKTPRASSLIHPENLNGDLYIHSRNIGRDYGIIK